MASGRIDEIIGYLNALKEQEIQLKQKDDQIKKYEDLLLTFKSTRFDDCFLIYSYDEDQENIEIITENYMEFTELAYDHHYLLIAKKESNRNVAIYLMAFDDDCQLESTIDAIDLLIERKRQQQQDDSSRVLSNKEIRIMNKLMEKKSSDYEKKITDQWDQLREFFKKTADLERQIGDQTKKMEKYEEQLKEMSMEKKEQMKKVEELEKVIDKQQQQLQEYVNRTEDSKQKMREQTIIIGDYKRQLMNATEQEMNQKKLINQLQEKVAEKEKIIGNQEKELDEYVRKSDYYGRRIDEQTRKIEEYEQKLKEMDREKKEQIRQQVFIPLLHSKPDLHLFLEDKNLEIIKNSTVVMDGIGNRLFKREEGDNEYEPPLKEINSQEQRRKEVSNYIEFIRINWNNPGSGSVIQKNIRNWISSNNEQLMYKPSEEEKEKSRKMFLNKFKLENTIGTIHFLSIQFRDRTRYYCFAISNYRIVHWNWYYTQQDTYSVLYTKLKRQRSWTENSKFTTEMEVNEEQSDRFVHTSNKDVFVENEKVVTWIKNNFDLEQQNNRCSIGFYNIPSLYNIVINSYDTSSM